MTESAKRSRVPKPVRVLIGTLVMALIVGGGLYYLTKRAGDWGVPYFSFTTAGGSECTNQWAGYLCEEVTDQDFVEWSHFDLPAKTTIVEAEYRRTHDYQLRSVLSTEADASASKATKAAVIERFGPCQDLGVPPAELEGYIDVCLINSQLRPPKTSNDEPGDARTGETWTVATGVADNGSRLTIINIESR